jgi:hypothetical protein
MLIDMSSESKTFLGHDSCIPSSKHNTTSHNQLENKLVDEI